MNKQNFFSLLIIMCCLCTTGVGQHCPWDGAYLLSIGAYSAQEPNAVIPNLQISLLDSLGEPLTRSFYQEGEWLEETFYLPQNPATTTHSGYIDNENPVHPGTIRFWFAEDKYTHVCGSWEKIGKMSLRIEDIDGAANGGHFETKTVPLAPAHFLSLCTDLTNWDSGPEGANLELFQPILVQLSPVSSPEDSPVEHILWTAQWSANDEYIAVGSSDSLLRIYAGDSYDLLQTFKMEGGVFRVRWHPSQPLLAVAAEGEGSCILNVSTKQRTPLPLPGGTGSRAVVWNPTGDQVLMADCEGVFSLWSLSGALLGKHKKENTMSYTAVDWHPEKAEWLAVSQKVRSITAKGELIKAIQVRPPEVLLLCVAWHPSGDFYVVGDYGNSDYEMPPLLQWRNAKGEVMFVSEISKAEYRNISWSPKGKTLATASDMLRVWSKKGKLLLESPSEHNLWGIDWSQDGKRIVTSDQEGVIGIWDAEGNRLKTWHWNP